MLRTVLYRGIRNTRLFSKNYINSAISMQLHSSRCFSTIYYAESDEYIRLDDNDSSIGYFGVSDYAQDQLNEIVHVDPPAEGEEFSIG